MTELVNNKVEMTEVEFDHEKYYKISNHDLMRPFFMSIVSDSNHWMFVSSNGGISAGRKNPDFALFPYYTDDKITESADITGSKSIFQIILNGLYLVWEPFSERYNDMFEITRNLYKSQYGNKVIFEEILHDAGLIYRYQWNSSNRFGFVRKVMLENTSNQDLSIELIDGIQNIVPFGVGNELQNSTSNLVDAYKRSELEPTSGIGIYALSAIIVDKAEPSEALEANLVWSTGLEADQHLLSSLQLNKFRNGKEIIGETDVKGEKGAYFVHKKFVLNKKSELKWKIIANVRQNHSQIIGLSQLISMEANLDKIIEEDIEAGTQNLIKLNATSDGLQYTADHLKDTRHFANTLFNIMRGGIFDHNYRIEKSDFVAYLKHANKEVSERNKGFIDKLKDEFGLYELKSLLSESLDVDLIRLCTEYLPLKFSRRHGDPSRPWNKFSINTQSEIDGSKILDYQGNWRDIFQNWEALAHAFPQFMEGMIFKFLNASTFDGYNPYRVTKGGFDWETIEPDNPWSYIGYWGDHQVIYLLKFLEFTEKHHPRLLNRFINQESFVYANVPYKIKSYEQILKDPKNTIDFDEQLDHEIRNQMSALGADGALLRSKLSAIHHVNFIEKILALVLSKLSNFIPEGGIWMNTQRPEWNDANNALVGNGVSMVTLYYLRRFLKFYQNILDQSEVEQVLVSEELLVLFDKIHEVLKEHAHLLSKGFQDTDRKSMTDSLGEAGSEFRETIYKNRFSGIKFTIPINNVSDFINISLNHLEHSIEVNKRKDGLFHAYNLMKVSENGISIAHLSEMLEGQVAAISSGYLDAESSLKLLDAMRNSAIYRAYQNSYMLYPNKALPGFLQKNNISKESVESSELLMKLIDDQNLHIINKDVLGGYHFNGNFKNANDVKVKLDELMISSYKPLVEKDREFVLQIFENVFNHIAFTGRSGTFYAYEGLGSIYWHMVSKLHLAVQEICLKAIVDNVNDGVIQRLKVHYYNIGDGIGVHKSPEVYGAFPTDPYSHTPGHRGAQQPGMTGQVKEDVLVRFGELGVCVKDGKIYFRPHLLKREEFLKESKTSNYFNLDNEKRVLELKENSLFFTYCQVPIVYKFAKEQGMEVFFENGKSNKSPVLNLDAEVSSMVFQRTGEIKQIVVYLHEEQFGNQLPNHLNDNDK